MNPAFRIILALSLPLPLSACGQSKPELFLDRTTTALECAAANDPDCADRGPRASGEDADAGAPRPAAADDDDDDDDGECDRDADCEYGEVCERRHGVSSCQPEAGRHGDDDGLGGSGGDAGYADDHHSGGDDARDEDRSGSNSGRH